MIAAIIRAKASRRVRRHLMDLPQTAALRTSDLASNVVRALDRARTYAARVFLSAA
jgi:hypothetical protein